MLDSYAILQPVIALVAWTMVMWLWMYATRIPAIQSSGMTLDRDRPNGEQMATLPSRVRWKADNYNHLFEQPTVFYALAISMALLGEGGGFNTTLAWSYVVLRVIHSIFHAMVNKIELRFVLFVLSNIPLFWLTFNGLLTIF